MHWTDRTRQQTEEMVLSLRDRVTRPVAVEIADFELVEVPAETIFPCVELPRHRTKRGEVADTNSFYTVGVWVSRSCSTLTLDRRLERLDWAFAPRAAKRQCSHVFVGMQPTVPLLVARHRLRVLKDQVVPQILLGNEAQHRVFSVNGAGLAIVRKMRDQSIVSISNQGGIWPAIREATVS